MTQYFCGNKLIFVMTDDGDHVVPDIRWYDYLLTREEAPTPRKVVLVDKIKDLEQFTQ
jgi:hypothetical protein